MASSKQPTAVPKHPLAYRVRSGVRFHRLEANQTAMVLHFPMRLVVLPAAWHPVLESLPQNDWVPLKQITQAVSHLPAAHIETFLNTLVRKGYLVRQGYHRLDEADYPTVSVIVPVRNRPTEITACLRTLQALDYPTEQLEIIVVDDASTDRTPDAVARFPNVRLLRMQQHRQVSHCRNRAADMARGEILAFIDSDCLADPTWLRELVPAFRDPTLGALGGRVDAACEENSLDRYEAVKSALKMGSWFKRSEALTPFFYVPACNLLVRKKHFSRLGGFREALHVGEDVDFCWRLQNAGYHLEYHPLGKVAHKHRNRLSAFCVRRFEYGTSEPILQGLHADRVKTVYLPWNATLFWLVIALAMALQSPLLLMAGAVLLMLDSVSKNKRLKSRQIPVTWCQLYTVVIRGYLSFSYHCCHFTSRYYLLFAPLLLVIVPRIGALMLGMHIMAGIVEYIVRKPRLTPWAFLLFFTLEQLSYQSGVWWQSLRSFNFRPVLPRIVYRHM